MIVQEINKKISYWIIGISMLHILLLAAYIFDYIPTKIESIYFYNIDRLFVLSVLFLVKKIIADKAVKITLSTSFFVYLSYFLIVNVKYYVDISSVKEILWQCLVSGSFIVSFITAIYVSSRK